MGMILPPALRPIPARLVQYILSSAFVDMRDLLVDNRALQQQLEAVHGLLFALSNPDSLQARVREVPSLVSWVYCFVT